MFCCLETALTQILQQFQSTKFETVFETDYLDHVYSEARRYQFTFLGMGYLPASNVQVGVCV